MTREDYKRIRERQRSFQQAKSYIRFSAAVWYALLIGVIIGSAVGFQVSDKWVREAPAGCSQRNQGKLCCWTGELTIC